MAEGISKLEQTINEFERALEEMRTELREGHSMLKELRRERKEIEKLFAGDIKKIVDQRVGEMVKRELDKIGPEIGKQTQGIYKRVDEQIQKLINIALGSEFSSNYGKEDLRPLLAIKLREWLTEIIEGA